MGGPRAERDTEFEALFDAVYPRVVALGQRMLGSKAAGEDLAAEALARAFARWRSVRRHPAPDAWVLRTATNLAIDQLRRKRPRTAETPIDSPEDAVAIRLALADAMARLSNRQRTVVTLRYLADLSERDVAAALSISPGTVKSTLSRGLANLRTDLGNGDFPVAAGDDERATTAEHGEEGRRERTH